MAPSSGSLSSDVIGKGANIDLLTEACLLGFGFEGLDLIANALIGSAAWGSGHLSRSAPCAICALRFTAAAFAQQQQQPDPLLGES